MKRFSATIITSIAVMLSITAPTSLGVVRASAPPDTSVDDTVNDFMDLERDVTTCISSNPLPGCGREPTSPGDRGGWQQLLLFGIMFAGMAAIFTRVYFSVRSRDHSTT